MWFFISTLPLCFFQPKPFKEGFCHWLCPPSIFHNCCRWETPVIIEYRPFIFRRCVLVAFSDLWPHYVLSPFSMLLLFLPLCDFCSFQLHLSVFTYILKSVDYTVFQISQGMKFLHCFGNASCCFMILRRRKRNVDLTMFTLEAHLHFL